MRSAAARPQPEALAPAPAGGRRARGGVGGDAGAQASERIAVERVEWTATLGNKRIGSSLENPHTFATRAVFNDRVLVDKVTYRFSEPEPGDVVVFKGPPSWNVNRSALPCRSAMASAPLYGR